MLGCCLNSFHFLWAILSTSTVHVNFSKPKKRIYGQLCMRDMRSAASGYEMGPTHAERERERERGKAKYPSILGGRETHEIRKERAEGRIGSYAYGDRVMSCRHARSLARSPSRPLAHFQTHLRSCTLTRVEKSKNGPAHSPLDRPRCPLLPSSTMEAWMDGWIGGIDFRKHLTPSPSQSGGGGRTYQMSKFSAEIDPSLAKRQVSDRPTFM